MSGKTSRVEGEVAPGRGWQWKKGEPPSTSVLMFVSPHPFPGSVLGRMPSGDVLSGMGIATFVEAGPSYSVSVNPPATTPEPSTEATPGSAKEKEVPPQPFILGKGFPAVPAKLANKIQRGEFVDMAELLKDNIEADRRHVASLTRHLVASDRMAVFL